MRYLKLLLVGIFLPCLAHAQRWEVGLFAGTANYIGDLAPDIAFNETKPAIGLNIKRNVSAYFSYSLNATFAAVSGNDKNFDYLSPRRLQFQSDIFEIAPLFEFNFFKFGQRQGQKRFTPYLFTGFSVFHFDPRATYNNENQHLQVLRTEGQGLTEGAKDPYSLWSYAIPIGGGLKFNLNEHFNMLVNVGYRTTFTDYLDDVGDVYADRLLLDELKGPAAAGLSDPSGLETGRYVGKTAHQRGSTDTKDWYVFGGVTLSYILKPPTCYRF